MNDPKKYKHPNCASKSHLKCKVARCTYLLYLFLYCVDAIVIIQMWVLNILYFQCNSTYGYLCTSKYLHILILYTCFWFKIIYIIFKMFTTDQILQLVKWVPDPVEVHPERPVIQVWNQSHHQLPEQLHSKGATVEIQIMEEEEQEDLFLEPKVWVDLVESVSWKMLIILWRHKTLILSEQPLAEGVSKEDQLLPEHLYW